jgi:chromosome segregation ATPase
MQFFVQAVAKGLGELDTRLGRVEIATSITEYEEKMARTEAERDEARGQVQSLDTQLREAQRELAELQQELVRQHVSFADHHAAKQEIMRLRAELEESRSDQPFPVVAPLNGHSQRKWWPLARPSSLH